MQVVSVNIASAFKMVPHAGASEPTGHFKKPVYAPVMARTLGLDGDLQADKVHHGGPDQALYVISTAITRDWAKLLARAEFHPGAFGENLTVDGLLDDDVCIGDTYRFGARPSPSEPNGPLVQVTSPRVPCFKLACAMNDPDFPKKFLATCRVGFYLRVLEEGPIAAGDPIQLIDRDEAHFSVRDLTNLAYFDRDNRAANAKASKIEALPEGWRTRFAERA